MWKKIDANTPRGVTLLLKGYGAEFYGELDNTIANVEVRCKAIDGCITWLALGTGQWFETTQYRSQKDDDKQQLLKAIRDNAELLNKLLNHLKIEPPSQRKENQPGGVAAEPQPGAHGNLPGPGTPVANHLHGQPTTPADAPSFVRTHRLQSTLREAGSRTCR